MSISSPRKLLLVEDEMITAVTESHMLKGIGYDMVAADSGEEALDIISREPSIDLVLMDIDLGEGIDGTETARQILAVRSVPIVFLTSHAERDMVEKVRGITRYGYVLKNSGEFVLQSSIEMAFELYEAHRALNVKNESLQAAEEKISHQNRLFTILSRTNEAIVRVHEAEELFRRICRICVEDGGFLMAWIGFVDPATRMVKPCCSYGCEEGYLEKSSFAMEEVPEGMGPAGTALRKELYDICNDFATDPRMEPWRQEGLRRGYRSLASFSIVTEGRAAGLLTVYAREKNFFNGEEICLLQQLTDDIAYAMGTFHDTTAHKRAEHLNEMLLSAIPHPAMLIRGKDKVVVAANKIAMQRGVKIGGHCWRDFGMSQSISPEDQEKARDHSGYVPPELGIRCTCCQGDKCLVENPKQNNPALAVRGKVFDTHWIKVDEEIYLHYTIDITERMEAEIRVTSLLKEKELLLREVQHRVKNNMNTMMNLLTLQVETAEDPGVVAALTDARCRLHSMEALYDKLYRSEDLKDIPICTYIPPLMREVADQFPFRDRVTIRSDMADFPLDARILSPLGLIVNELVTNAMKYAFTGRERGVIHVSTSLEDNHVTLIFEDDGAGMPESVDLEQSGGFGLQLVTLLVNQLKGTIEMSRDGGTKFTIMFDTPGEREMER